MLKLSHNCTHLRRYQSNAQNSPSQASIVRELWLPEGQAGFRKGRGTRDQIDNIRWIIKKAREFQKNIFFCFTDYAKTFDCVSTTQGGKFFKIWEYQTTKPASWEICMQVKKQQLQLYMEKWTRFKIGKDVCQGCVLSPCLFNLYAEFCCAMLKLLSRVWLCKNFQWSKYKNYMVNCHSCCIYVNNQATLMKLALFCDEE